MLMMIFLTWQYKKERKKLVQIKKIVPVKMKGNIKNSLIKEILTKSQQYRHQKSLKTISHKDLSSKFVN